MVALTALAMATSCGLFQPAGVAPQVSNVQVVQSQARVQAGNPGVTPGTAAVQVQFNVPMNQPSVERSVNVFPGTYDVNTNPSSFQKLQLTSMCNGQWRVRNPNAQPMSFQWDVYGKTEKGVGVAAPSSDTFLQSTMGSNTLRVFVGAALQNTKATNPAACSSNLYGFAWTDSRTVQVTPVAALQANKPYVLAVSTSAKNEAGTQELSQPVSASFVTQISSERQLGLLQPEGTVSFANGSTVRATPDAFSGTPVSVYSERVFPESLPTRLPDGFTAVGNYFRIGTVNEDLTASGSSSTYQVTLPIPSGEDIANLAIAAFIPDVPEIYGFKYSNYWTVGSPTRSLAINGKPYIGVADLFKQGTVFVLIKMKPLNTLSSSNRVTKLDNNINVPFTFSCLDVECNTVDSNLVKQKLENAYLYWIRVMNLSFDERPIIAKTQIANNYRLNDNSPNGERICIPPATYNGVYEPAIKAITICANDSGGIVQPSYLDDLIFHEMFHATQRGISNGVRLDSRDRPSFVGGSLVIDFIAEGTAAAAGGSASTGVSELSINVSNIPIVANSRAEFAIQQIPYTLSVAQGDSLDVPGDEYRFQDFWSYLGRRLERGITALKPLFQVNRQTRYTNSGNDNADKVNNYIVSQGLPGGLKLTYWEYLKNQAMEVNFDLRGLGMVCDLNRNISDARKPYLKNPIIKTDVNYTTLASQTQITSPTNVRHMSASLWNITFSELPASGGDVRVTLRGGNNDIKAVIYKVKQQNPSNCAKTPDLVNGTGIIRSVMPDERLVVLAGNTSFDQAAPLQVEVQRLTTPDMDDGTLDGNQLSIIGNSSSADANNDGIADSFLATDALRYLSTDFAGEDADGNGRIGDGRVDMSDFRRLRDLLLRPENLGTFGGAATHPKLNVGAGSSVLKYADFNGNGTLKFNERVSVPGLEGNGFTVTGFNIVPSGANLTAQPVTVTRDAQGLPLLSDFEVFYNTISKTPGTWVDADFTLPQVTRLLGSGDLEVWARDLFDYQGVVQVVSDIENASFGAGYVHTRTNQRHVYTAPAGTYSVRLAGLNANGEVIVGLRKTVTLTAGQDVLFAPATAFSAVFKTTYNSNLDDCARLQGVYSFNTSGLFDGAVPEIPTNDSYMAFGQNLLTVRELVKQSNWPLRLEAGTYRHCNFPAGQARLGWDFNYDFFGTATPTGFFVQAFSIVTIQDNRWPGLAWNSTDFNDPQTTGGSVPLKITVTSSFPGDAQQLIRLLLPGTAASLLLRPATEAQYRLEAVDDDQNPDTSFSLTANNVNIPYLTDAKLTYRGSSAWFHQIFCDINSACARGGIQSQRTSGPSSNSLTAPALPVPVIVPRPRF